MASATVSASNAALPSVSSAHLAATVPIAAPPDAQSFTVDFHHDGPLGLAFSSSESGGSSIISVNDGGHGAAAGIAAGDMISHVNGDDVSALGHKDVLAVIRASSRPLRLTLARSSRVAVGDDASVTTAAFGRKSEGGSGAATSAAAGAASNESKIAGDASTDAAATTAAAASAFAGKKGGSKFRAALRVAASSAIESAKAGDGAGAAAAGERASPATVTSGSGGAADGGGSTAAAPVAQRSAVGDRFITVVATAALVNGIASARGSSGTSGGSGGPASANLRTVVRRAGLFARLFGRGDRAGAAVRAARVASAKADVERFETSVAELERDAASLEAAAARVDAAQRHMKRVDLLRTFVKRLAVLERATNDQMQVARTAVAALEKRRETKAVLERVWKGSRL